MGGKNRHSQDRLYITATEWRNEHGGKKRKKTDEGQPVDFKKCALSMVNYETPCCLEEGVVFEFTALTKFLNKYKANPVSGTEATIKEILRLNMVMIVCVCFPRFCSLLPSCAHLFFFTDEKSGWNVALSSHM